MEEGVLRAADMLHDPRRILTGVRKPEKSEREMAFGVAIGKRTSGFMETVPCSLHGEMHEQVPKAPRTSSTAAQGLLLGHVKNATHKARTGFQVRFRIL